MQEDYKTWSIRKFRRVLPQLMEAAHMAPDNASHNTHHKMLVPVAQAFKDLHPRAYANWQQWMREEYGFTYQEPHC